MLGTLLILAVKFYQQAISPWLRPSCRYSPTCSSYMITCIDRFGPFKGTYLGLKRLLRCHPFASHGYDPPPTLTTKDL